MYSGKEGKDKYVQQCAEVKGKDKYVQDVQWKGGEG